MIQFEILLVVIGECFRLSLRTHQSYESNRNDFEVDVYVLKNALRII